MMGPDPGGFVNGSSTVPVMPRLAACSSISRRIQKVPRRSAGSACQIGARWSRKCVRPASMSTGCRY